MQIGRRARHVHRCLGEQRGIVRRQSWIGRARVGVRHASGRSFRRCHCDGGRGLGDDWARGTRHGCGWRRRDRARRARRRRLGGHRVGARRRRCLGILGRRPARIPRVAEFHRAQKGELVRTRGIDSMRRIRLVAHPRAARGRRRFRRHRRRRAGTLGQRRVGRDEHLAERHDQKLGLRDRWCRTQSCCHL